MIKAILIAIIKGLSQFGHVGVFLAMAFESACIPLPSEVTLPLAGYMAYMGKGTVLSMAVTGTLGCLFGSLLAYVVGYFGGRPLVIKYGKYVFLSEKELERTDRFFEKHGEITIFFSRLLPVVRTFISLPAGISRMNVFKFSLLTVLGSFPWCLLFVYLGHKMGENWITIEEKFKGLDYAVAAVIVAGVIYFIYKKVKERKK